MAWRCEPGRQNTTNAFPVRYTFTTPESLEAILLRKANWKDVFENLETIVIDEAHYFALTERGSHLISLLERIVSGIKKQPQRIAVTATVGNPDELLQWLIGNQMGGESVRVKNTTDQKRDFRITHFTEDELEFYPYLYSLLGRKKSIVFERSRTGTEHTASRINELNISTQPIFPVKVKTHHSSVSKQLREGAEGSIKQKTESSIDAIISTSTLELGIDIGDLDQVIQIGGLNSSSSFLQRVGRTGRRKGKFQFFRGLTSDEDELILLIGCVNLGIKRKSENILFPKKAFHILAHQSICLCLQNVGITADQIWGILSNASCFSNITRLEFDLMIHHMLQEDFLRAVDQMTLLTSNKTEKEFLRANWKRLFAIFDTGPMYNVVDGKKIIGTLDSGFAMVQELPFVFVLGGQEWNALKIDHEMQQILVKKNESGIAPKWTSIANYDVPFELAQEVGRLLMNDEQLEFLERSAKTVFERKRETYFKLQWDNSKWILDSSDEASNVHIWTFSGDKINRTLAKIISIKIDKEVEHGYINFILSLGKP